jgi:hypothetical protein
MALLGTFWHVIGPCTAAPVTGGAALLNYGTYQHSLPTVPEVVIPVLRSIGSVGGQNNGLPQLLALGGTATYCTVGWAMPSVASMPTIAFDIYAAMIHSGVR